jgi:cobalt/nickel transport system ATP-binding protein
MSEPLIALEGVHFGYADRAVLRGVDFVLHRGERVALTGPNGAGKSTLLHLLVGLRRPSVGRVLAFGEPRQAEADFVPVRRRVGLVFQDADDQLFCPTVLEDVAFGPLNLGRSRGEARADAEATLAALGLEGYGERVTYRLSAGEKRLVALATVLAMRPEVLLLDEPTNGLDEATEARFLGHLEALDLAMVVVSHDRRVLARLATRAVALHEGRLESATLHSHEHRHRHVHLHAPGFDGDHDHGSPAPLHRDHHQRDRR